MVMREANGGGVGVEATDATEEVTDITVAVRVQDVAMFAVESKKADLDDTAGVECGYFRRHRLVGLGPLKVFWNRKTQRFTKRRRFRPFLPIQVCGKLPSHLLRAMEEKKI